MLNFLFILKTFALTILIVFLLQLEVDGSYTVEDKAMFWLQDSAVVQPLRNTATGAVKFADDGLSFVKKQFKQSVRSATAADSKSN